ncbi:MAG TPA: response regulator [Caulobacteraceae bacterium]|jgi:CheY-like chemotaxis protein
MSVRPTETCARSATWHPTVLVVEDETMIRELLAETLRQGGCEVVEAGSGDEALAILRGSPEPDVLVTDVKMPGCVDGLELAARVRRQLPQLKVIITSGHAGACAARGLADSFFSKPYALERVLSSVQTLAAAA